MPAFSVAVATPADQYQLTDRATKYAILLIVLTFMSFFVLESMTSLRLHPMQYLLVGLSLVMFYLLLLALSEHIGFTAAWITASPGWRVNERGVFAGDIAGLAEQYFVHRGATGAGWRDVGAAAFTGQLFTAGYRRAVVCAVWGDVPDASS